MKINKEKFISWIEEKFGSEYKQSGDEIKINSIFKDDEKFKLWCNVEKNTFHCWKTDQSGTLPALISKVDGISFFDAKKIICDTIVDISKLDEILFGKPCTEVKNNEFKIKSIKLPDYTYKITSLNDNNDSKTKAISHLNERKVPIDNMYVCTGGWYKDRIIIPYIDQNNNLIYWNGRDYTNLKEDKYKTPDKKIYKVERKDVVYFYKYPKKGSTVLVCEGEFDSICLSLCNIPSCAIGGKEISENQMEILQDYNICLALDSDEAGQQAMQKIGRQLKNFGFYNLEYIQVPIGFKDWNKVYIHSESNKIFDYIKKNKKVFNNFSMLI